METMKTDMAGGAAVIAAMSALDDLGVKTRVTGYVPLVENMPSGTAIRPGDVLTIRNGKTVEVLNTDAEGRLILADALSLASEDKPDAIVDLATLTGACMVALGEKIAGLMGNDDAWGEQVQRRRRPRRRAGVAAAAAAPSTASSIESEIADMKNIGRQLRRRAHRGAVPPGVRRRRARGSTSTSPGPRAANADDGYLVKGGTGFGVRTLVELARTLRAAGPRRDRHGEGDATAAAAPMTGAATRPRGRRRPRTAS